MPIKDDDDHVVTIGEDRQPNVLPSVKEQALRSSRPAHDAGPQRHNKRHAGAEAGAVGAGPGINGPWDMTALDTAARAA